MAEVAEVKTCSNPGCDQPGINQCSACKTTPYCGPICQTADWVHHKEECQGHLRKVGTANLDKAVNFGLEQNWVQTLRYGEIAATKLKQLKDRRLETVEAISAALACKYDALNFTARRKEAMECIKECYTLWAMNHLRNPGSMTAALLLIQSCLLNKEYEDAEHYARHAMFMINEMTDNFIPIDQRPRFLADGSYFLARAIHELARSGGIPSVDKQKAGEEAIVHARKALEIHTQLSGTESQDVANDMMTLADLLDFFNKVDDDEILRLHEQATAICIRVDGNSSMNVAASNGKLGSAYGNRAVRAHAANDLDRCLANLEPALTCFRESARIYKAINHVDCVNDALRHIATTEERIRRVRIEIAAAPAPATRG